MHVFELLFLNIRALFSCPSQFFHSLTPPTQNEDAGPRLSLTHEMHDRGINMRCLGLLYEAVTGEYWKTRLLTEMILRIAKVSGCLGT